VFNTESRGFKLNAFKLKFSHETLWLPDNTDGLPQHYIVNSFRHLPKCNLQIVAEVISIRDQMCAKHYLWGILSDYSFRAVVQVHLVCFD
jgi:3',5'-cyclic AMP phosphodiesterase CpdA